MLEKDPLATLFLLLAGVQALALLGAWLAARRGTEAPPRWLVAWDRLAQSRAKAVALTFALALGLSTGLSLVRWPVPRVQDEFSYLLAAETFAAGRLTNPTHPLWPHFETEHVLQRPTYTSKYPPMQALSLALGIVLTGEPVVGVWLGVAAACAAMCWMLYAFVPPRWALLGGVLAATHPGVLGWWAQGFWGGQMAMLGGALLFGGVGRIVGAGARPLARDAVLMALGLAVLANSRPYEGLVASLPAAAALAVGLLGPRRPSIGTSLRNVVAPACVVLTLASAGMMEHNRAVTGHALRMPYQAHNDQYGATPLFLWQDDPPEKEYRDRKLRDFYAGWERSLAERQTGAYGVAKFALHKVGVWNGFYFGPALGTLALGLVLRRRGGGRDWWTAFAGTALLWCLAGSLLCVWFNPHYLAPAAPLVVLLIVEGSRRLAEAGPRARRLLRAGLAAQGVSVAALGVLVPVVLGGDGWWMARERMIADLKAKGGDHLVILRHGREYTPHEEWIYNEPDIDAQRVVWARELDSAAAAQLRKHFAGRRVWLLEAYRPRIPDGTPNPPPLPPPELVPYPPTPEWMLAPPTRLLIGEAVAAVAVCEPNASGTAAIVAAPAGRPALVVFDTDGAARDVALPAPAASLAALQGRTVAAALAGLPALALVDLASGQVATTPLPSPARHVAIGSAGEQRLLVASCPEARAVVVLADESGTWRRITAVTVPGWPAAATLADVTGDGAADLVITDPATNAVWLAQGSPQGTVFGEAARIGEALEPLALTVADLDGDGALDIAVTEGQMDRVLVLHSRGGRFEASRPHCGIAPLGIAAADLTGDGKPDLAVATRWGHGLTLLGSASDGEAVAAGFAAPAEITLGAQTWFEEKASSVAVGDVDGDRRPDVVVGAAAGVFVYRTAAGSR